MIAAGALRIIAHQLRQRAEEVMTGKVVYQAEFTMPDAASIDEPGGDLCEEDGGAALILYHLPKGATEECDDASFGVRLFSYDEARTPQNRLFRRLLGKRLRVIVEEIDA